MIYVKKVILNECMSSTSSSIVNFNCGADKLFFDTLVETESMLKFFDELNFDDLQINLQFICMNDEFEQKVDDDGFLLLTGTFLHTYKLSYTSLSLKAKINYPNWLKLKNDFLLLSDEQMYFNFEKINFKSTRGNIRNRDSLNYDVEALIDGYQIIKLLKFKSLN